jgi:hypothetical protein
MVKKKPKTEREIDEYKPSEIFKKFEEELEKLRAKIRRL